MNPPFTDATTRPTAPRESAEKLPNDQFELPFRSRFGADKSITHFVIHIIAHKSLIVQCLFTLFTHISRDIQKTETDRFSGAKRGIQGTDICQTLGQQLGTLMPRPQNPWAVRGEQSLPYPLGTRGAL